MAGRLIVGLGNPGKKYALTRHNLGFMIVQAFAKQKGWEFKKKFLLQGEVASGVEDDKKVTLFLPTTYMNLSGRAVRRAKDFSKFALVDLLVVVDDVALPFGKMRFRPAGSAGGHNGLKSIEQELGSQEYARLRVGIGTPQNEPLESYVLSSFTQDEQRQLPQLVDKGVEALTLWIAGKALELDK